jgi:hypothetical protein
MPPNPNAAPPAHSATTRAFVQWIRSAAPYIHAFRGKTFIVAFGGEVVADGKFVELTHDLKGGQWVSFNRSNFQRALYF